MKKDNEERICKALELRKLGYSCSQCVLMSCADIVGLDETLAARIGAGLGAGVATGEICGVANALAIAAGLMEGDASPAAKKSVMPKVRELCRKFSEPVGGCITCRDLKGKCGRPCDQLIADGVGLLA